MRGLALVLQAAMPHQITPPPPMPPPLAANLPGPQVSLPLRPGHAIVATFVVADDRGYLRIVMDNSIVDAIEVDDVGKALALLADRRFAAMWPAITAWGGTDLVRLRDAALRRARERYLADLPAAPPTNMTQSTVRPRVRAILQFSEALSASGDIGAARALLTSERDATDRSSDWGRAEWAALTGRLASLLVASGDRRAGITLLDTAKSGLPEGTDYAINFDVNRAALLAEAGEYAQALTVIDAARLAFEGPKRGAGTRVKGSDRQFGWIRGCALAGLGRADEARRALAPLRSDREPRQWGFVLASNISVRTRAYACTHDAPAAADALAEDFAALSLTQAAFLYVQPGHDSLGVPPAFRASVAADAKLVPLLTDRLRILPKELIPALNRWRHPAS